MANIDLAKLESSLKKFDELVIFQDGTYKFDYPIINLEDEEGRAVEIVSAFIVKKIINKIFELQNDATNAIVKHLEKENKKIEKENKKNIADTWEIRKINSRISAELSEYKENYGEVVSWNTILEELYQGKKNIGSILIPKSNWRYYYLKKPKYKKSIDYWYNVFIFLHVVKRVKRDYLALCSIEEARVILEKFVKEN